MPDHGAFRLFWHVHIVPTNGQKATQDRDENAQRSGCKVSVCIYNANMSTSRVAVSVPYDFSAIPKGCRKSRTMSGTRVAVVDLVVGSAARYPIVYTVTHRDTERRGSREKRVVSVVDRRWGEGRLWMPHSQASNNDIALAASQCLHSALRDRYSWSRYSAAEVHAFIDKAIAEVQTSFRVIEGEFYQHAIEHVWVVNEPCRYKQSVVIELTDEPTGELVFRLDELESAKSAAAAVVKTTRGPERYKVTVEGEATVVRPDLLQRSSGRSHAARVRGWKVVESVREAYRLADRLESWLADPVAAVLPPGLSIDEGRHLLAALLQVRGSLAGITDEQTASNISAA